MVSPNTCWLLGSPRMQWSNFSGRASAGPLQQFDGPVDRDASSSPVMSSESEPRFGLAAVSGEMIECGGDETRNAAFHVDGAAPVQHAVRNLASEGRMMPGLYITGGHHVGMSREHEVVGRCQSGRRGFQWAQCLARQTSCDER